MHWYLVHTKPRQEECAQENLERQGYECYLPVFSKEKLRQNGVSVVNEPLFPRYLFIRLGQGHADQSWTPIRSTKGVSRLVSFGMNPAKVPDGLIDHLRSTEADVQANPERLFTTGDQVRLSDGAFVGIDGVYQMADGERRVMVLIELSHIPFDRNGIKFYSPAGEILKAEEQAIVSGSIPAHVLGKLPGIPLLPPVDVTATEAYVRRYVDHFGAQCLAGLRVGLYEHSAVGRDLTKSVLVQLGAKVFSLGQSDDFVPVDTEAVGEADLAQARNWCKAHQLDAVVSTDGDGDRPLVFDENGEFVRGDLLGLMCARELGIQTLAVPVSCNTAIEQSGAFRQVLRTRIGSPFVIAAMNDLTRNSPEPVAGFEANGGFLLGAAVSGLAALPTRDALLPMLSLLARSARERRSISALVDALPGRYTYSDRIKNFPTEQSRDLLQRLVMAPSLQANVAGKTAIPSAINTTDGVRLTFPDGDIVHLRASGNAPELRCYAESATLDKAKFLCTGALSQVA